jgi:RNA polymerase sigma-70 factor (ECF subfamily)
MAASTPPDELGRLMQEAQSGNADAYRQLLRTITPRLRSIVGGRRGFAGPEAVEDLVQDVLLSVHAVRASFCAIVSPTTPGATDGAGRMKYRSRILT